MRKTTIQLWLAIITTGWLACAAQAQMYAPQPSPAYHYGQQPAGYARSPVAAPQLAVDDGDEYDDDEGIYWFWGQKWPGLALGPKIGTTGIGVDLTFGVNNYVNLRGGFNYGAFSLNTSLDGVDYDFDVDMQTFPLLVDIHPFGGHFHISAGLYLQPGTKADIEGTPTGNEQIGEHTYPPDVIGTLFGTIEVKNDVAPYLGIGFGNPVNEEQLLTFMLDLGLVFQSYDVSLTSDGAGMGAALPTFREDLKKEEKLLQKDAEDWEIFPVLAISIAWHF